MLVKTHKDGTARTGLQIGDANARRYFSKRSPSIELRLDDLHIQCTLAPDFWQGRSQIHDPRLSEWLEFKVARWASGRDPVPLRLVPCGIDAFIVSTSSESRLEAMGDEIAHARKNQAERMVAPASHHAHHKELSVA